MWMARPSFLPLGSGPDLTHHVLLIEFIERHWTLVHEASVESFLGEMVHYTPGSHILAALTGALLGSNGLHVVHGLVAATVALKVGFVFLIALRVLPPDASRVPLAFASVVLLLAPRAYLLGSFIHDSFFAQVVAECFVVALWWMLTVWDQSPSPDSWRSLPLSALRHFTRPVFVGAPIVACAALIAARREMPVSERTRQFAIAVLPAAMGRGVVYLRPRRLDADRAHRRVGAQTGRAGIWLVVSRAVGHGNGRRVVRTFRSRNGSIRRGDRA